MHRILTLFVAILFSTWILAQPADSTYRTPGSHTFTIPTGYTATLEVSVWGGGGGGGTMTGGGGGAAFAMSTIVLGEGTYNVTVGAGGMAGMAGGTSNFNDAVIAVGGSSTLTVNGGAGGADTSCTGDIRFSGGHGGLGQLDGGGGGGGEAAGPEGNGANGGDKSGGFGGIGGADSTSGGDGGDGGFRYDQADAQDGMAPGGGGGGRHGQSSDNYIGIGGDGMVQIVVTDYALPISLLSFDGFPGDHSIKLTWKTATETNNDYMAIERSTDGIHFTDIGRVAGAGTSFDVHSYEFIDHAPVAGVNYYRLRQVDVDGIATRHKIISVKMNQLLNGDRVAIYPNPARDLLNLRWEVTKTSTRILVYDLTGKVQITGQVEAGIAEFNLPVQELAAGTYILQVVHDQTTNVMRFQKQ